MRKSILKIAGVALVALASINLKAQEYSTFEIGLQASPLIGWMASDQQFATGGTIGLGYEYGVNTIFNFKPNVGLATGIFINHQGAKTTFERTVSNADGNLIVDEKYNFRPELMYLRIPLTLKMITNEIGYMKYYGLFGPDLSILTSSKMKFSGKDGVSAKEFSEDTYRLRGAFIPFRFGLVVGGGVHYSIAGNTSLVFGVQYNNSFFNQVKDNFNDKLVAIDQTGNENLIRTESKENGRLQYFSLNIGVLF
jgi:hypothetical protein